MTDRELARGRPTANASMDIPIQDTQGSAVGTSRSRRPKVTCGGRGDHVTRPRPRDGVWRTQRRGETAPGAACRWARAPAMNWKLRTGSPRFPTHRGGKGACGRRARRSRSTAGINGALTTHARLKDPLWRLLKHCARAAMTAPKSSWAPRSPTRTADARPTHRQNVRADQRARGPQRDGIARATPPGEVTSSDHPGPIRRVEEDAEFPGGRQMWPEVIRTTSLHT